MDAEEKEDKETNHVEEVVNLDDFGQELDLYENFEPGHVWKNAVKLVDADHLEVIANFEPFLVAQFCIICRVAGVLNILVAVIDEVSCCQNGHAGQEVKN